MPVAELERVIGGLSPENYAAAVKFIMYLSDTQGEGGRMRKGNLPDRPLGIANGEFEVPDDIDWCNDEIAELFGVA